MQVSVVQENAKRRGWTQKSRRVFRALHKDELPYRKDIFRRLKWRAKKDGKEFTLTTADWVANQLKDCHYCGGKLPLKGLAWDRVDSDRGYTPDNVVPCCTICNSMKSNYKVEDFLAQVKKISERMRL